MTDADPGSRGVREVRCGDALLAIIVPGSFTADGVRFMTSRESSLQLAYMSHPGGRTIEPHVHPPVRREISATQEVFILRKGRLRVDFYADDRRYLESQVLVAGDVLLFVSGGHGFEVLEDIDMIEVKQGPYVGDADKVRFTADPARGGGGPVSRGRGGHP